MKNEQLFKESVTFINENYHCLSDQIPQYLIEYWITDNFRNEDEEATEQWSIFMYALICKKPIEKEFQIETEEFENLRQNWQLALSIISVSNLTDKKIEPFKLFDIENLGKTTIIEII